MDTRLAQFIRALRAAGVRISLAESQDALAALDRLGVANPDHFRAALKTTLVKEARDQSLFDYFYPLFFFANLPPLTDIAGQMTGAEEEQLRAALRALAAENQALRNLLDQLLAGQRFTAEQLLDFARQSGLESAEDIDQRPWFERRMKQVAGLAQLKRLLEQLLEQLAQLGLSEKARQALRGLLQENLDRLTEQVANFVGTTLAEQMAQQASTPKPDLLDIPFSRLREEEVDQIRDEVRRLAARLRSRVSLRQKRAKGGKLDPRRTMRANMRYGGTPVELKFRSRRVKPSLVVICDVSTSVRYCAEFLLTLIYELQDQVARANSFIFISDLSDISMAFKEYDTQEAVAKVMLEHPPGYYNTDLGNCLATFQHEYLGLVTGRTTVILLGDGRNNYNDPRLDIVQDIQRRCRRLLWFCPEKEELWGTGDSDMHRYAPLTDGVYYVNTLRDLMSAVDQILADG